MNTFITQAQEAAKEWATLGTAFAQEQSKIMQEYYSGTTARPDASGFVTSMAKAAEQADEFLIKAVKLADAQGALLLDVAVQGSVANDALAPVIASYKNASKAVVTTFEQIVQSKKALYAARTA
jgi:hypothetical protein